MRIDVVCPTLRLSIQHHQESKNPAEAGFFKKLKLTDKPGSVVDSHSSRPAIAHWLKQPTRVQYGPYLMNPYLALLRVEFTVPRTVTSRAVRSYRTLSPLPDPACAGHRRFALCCTGRGFPPQALPGTLPYGARTFLPSARLPFGTTTKRRLSGQLRRRMIGEITTIVTFFYRLIGLLLS